MNWQRTGGNWKQIKGKVREKWGRLTDNQIHIIAGQRDQLVGKIQETFGIAADAAEHRVRAWEESHRRAWDTNRRGARERSEETGG